MWSLQLLHTWLRYSPVVSLALWVDLPSTCDSVMPRIRHLKNTGLLSDADLPTVETFHHTTPPKSSLFMWALTSSGRPWCTSWRLSKILSFTQQVKCYHWQQILPVVFLEAAGSIHSFLRKWLPNAQVWMTVVCLPFFQIKIVLKVASSGCKQPHKGLFSK